VLELWLGTRGVFLELIPQTQSSNLRAWVFWSTKRVIVLIGSCPIFVQINSCSIDGQKRPNPVTITVGGSQSIKRPWRVFCNQTNSETNERKTTTRPDCWVLRDWFGAHHPFRENFDTLCSLVPSSIDKKKNHTVYQARLFNAECQHSFLEIHNFLCLISRFFVV